MPSICLKRILVYDLCQRNNITSIIFGFMMKARPLTCDRSFNFVVEKGLCYAGIGKGASGYETTVSLTSHCGVGGTAAHEIFHALGRLHEQNRRDKENYVDAPGKKDFNVSLVHYCYRI